MSQEYCDYVLDQLAPLPGISAKRMFGGFGLFRGGLMFGIIIDDVLYYKTAGSNRASYEAAGSTPFTYETKKKTVTLSYWTVPALALDDEDILLEWTKAACAAAIAAKPKPKKKSAKTKR
jgi:DNA transformation protein